MQATKGRHPMTDTRTDQDGEQGDGRIGSIIQPESRVLSTGVLDGSRADRDIPRFGADEAGPF
jgi:hypothetical protein